MEKSAHIPYQVLHTLKQAGLETAWPTRCALCDKPGAPLCEACKLSLPFIDQSLACPLCGAPAGLRQCTECNSVMLRTCGLSRLPFDSCSNSVVLDERSLKVVTTFKDGGERLLGDQIAFYLACLVNPSWYNTLNAITYVPASPQSMKRRGFDHGMLLAHALSAAIGIPSLGLLARPATQDQRRLNRLERLENMRQAFAVNPAAKPKMPRSVLLIDDVMTTGATLYAASMALKANGAQQVRCLTFARA
ncbi:MAG: phosphoribosyltransferase family protein [Coriobacteriia bacterium]|nr:phosphoribosyltransferase family protein [Coriobacteriia bacterium]